MLRILRISFLFPAAFLIVDFFSNKTTITFNTHRTLGYIIGSLGSIAFWVGLLNLLSRVNMYFETRKKWLTVISAIHVLLISLFLMVMAVSMGYFYEFGHLPNKYACQYLVTEWNDAISLIIGYITPGVIIAGMLSLIGIYGFQYFIVRSLTQTFKTNNIPLPKTLFAVCLVILVISGSIGFFSKKMGTVFPMDFNSIQAALQYRFSDDTGKGYSAPIRMNMPPFTEARLPSNVLLIINETLRADFLSRTSLVVPMEPITKTTSIINNDSLSIVYGTTRTNSSSTRVSLPAILMGLVPTSATSEEYHRQPTLWNIAKALGYSTFFITPQNWDWQNLDLFFLQKQVDHVVTAKQMGAPFVNNAGVDDRRILDSTNSHFLRLQSAEKPFFGVIQFNCTHQPYNSGNPGESLTANSPELYQASTRYLDSLIAQIYDQLNNAGLKNKTLIIVTSDHGESFKFRGLGRINCMYEEVLRVPFWISFPSTYYATPAGRSQFEVWNNNRNASIQNADIFPSLMAYWNINTSVLNFEYVGKRLDQPIDSLRIISGTNTGDIRKWNKEEFYLIRNHIKFLAMDKKAIRLFDLRADPLEQKNLWDDERIKQEHLPWIIQYISDHPVLSAQVQRMKIDLSGTAISENP